MSTANKSIKLISSYSIVLSSVFINDIFKKDFLLDVNYIDEKISV